jgi:hypothetical protein
MCLACNYPMTISDRTQTSGVWSGREPAAAVPGIIAAAVLATGQSGNVPNTSERSADRLTKQGAVQNLER